MATIKAARKGLLLGSLFLLGVVPAMAVGEYRLTGSASEAAAFNDTVKAMDQIITVIYYIIYIVGSVSMAMAGFKLNSGDIAGFTKTFLGGAFLFCSPLVIKSLQALANGTAH